VSEVQFVKLDKKRDTRK